MEQYVGVDVSKDELEIRISGESKSFTERNSEGGIRKVISKLKSYSIKLIAMESTGVYHKLLAKILWQEDLPVSIVCPVRIRFYAKSKGYLAKTDKLDAAIIVEYAEKANPPLTPKPDPSVEALQELVTRRNQLKSMIAMEKNRLPIAPNKTIHTSILNIIKDLEREVRDLDKLITAAIKINKALKTKSAILQSSRGVGPVVAAVLLSCLPELGELNKKQIASLIGVAPFNNDSGKMIGVRQIKGGRAGVRSALYMAILSIIAGPDCSLKAKYCNLVAKKKKPKVAMVACMRTLIVRLNAMIRDNKAWVEPLYAIA